ncbi:MAG: hypothetical protein JJLCMIEE_03442 [Acidimicrobiales bacterium]|nr:hypothetical protein [Acidimicrobiales bacterium]
MSFCTNCGTENSDESRFCSDCGGVLEAPAPAGETQGGDLGQGGPPGHPPVPPDPTSPGAGYGAQPPLGGEPPGPFPAASPPGGGRRNGLIIGAVVAVVVVAAVVAGFLLLRDGDGQSQISSEETTTTTVSPARSGEGWTVLVYMIGDTDLEPWALIDIEEMAAAAGQAEDLNIVVLADRSPDYTSEGVMNLSDWETGKVIEVGGTELSEVDDLGEVNMGDPATLADFIEFGVSEYPASKYSIVLWDHGAGWPGMGPDETDGADMLTTAEIAEGLGSGLEASGLDRFDMLGFDACLMANYEVAAAMAPHAQYLVASEELEPGHGWNYEGLAAAAGEADTPDLGQEILDSFQAQAESEQEGEAITLSVVDLAQMDALQDALGNWTEAVGADIETYAPTLGEVRAQALSFGRSPDDTFDSQLTDLGSIVSGVGEQQSDLAAASEEVSAALEGMVLSTISGPATSEATGLSVYFPPYLDLYDQEHAELEGIEAWEGLLTRFYEAGEAIPEAEQPAFDTEQVSDHFFDEDGLNIFATFDPSIETNLAEATIFYGIVDETDGSVMFLGEEPGSILEDGQAAAIYDLTFLQISDGQDTMAAYAAITFDEESGLFLVDIPMAYYPPGSEEYIDALLELVVDPEDGVILSETYYVVEEEGTFGELTADPEGIVVPIVVKLYPDGTSEWVPTSDVGLYADLPNLSYEFVPLDPGTEIYAELQITDYGGNFDSVFVQDAVP